MSTSAPASLTNLMAYYTSQGGVNLGIVGDTAHAAKGTSYHLGKDQLLPSAYSIQTARDRAGLSNYASAVDLGKVDGSLKGLQAFSRWYVDQCRHNAPDTRDVREVIYSPDGSTVLRWDRERGIASEPRDGEADFSHRTHTHISFYRDSRLRDQRPAFRRYFEPAPVPAGHTVHFARNAVIRVYARGKPAIGNKACIESWTDEVWKRPASHADCANVIHRVTCDGTSGAQTVMVLSGAYKGKCIRVGANGVTVS